MTFLIYMVFILILLKEDVFDLIISKLEEREKDISTIEMVAK